MVDVAGAVVEDTGPVGAPVGGIDGDGDGGIVDRAAEAVASSVADESVDSGAAALGLAILVLGNVRISSLRGDAVSLDVVEGG